MTELALSIILPFCAVIATGGAIFAGTLACAAILFRHPARTDDDDADLAAAHRSHASTIEDLLRQAEGK